MQKKSKSAKDIHQLSDRGALPTPLSIQQLSSDNSNMGFPDEKPSPSLGIEDLPYFTEKYPGKVCCLCNLSERSSLGQGDFLRVKATAEEHDVQELNNLTENEKNESRDSSKLDKTAQAVRGRTKNSNKNRFFPNNENINELDKVGQIEPLTLKTLLDGAFFYVHRMCAMWSTGLNRNMNEELLQLEEVVARSLKRKCKFCGQYGASVTCKMNCDKAFHLPCAAASGCFLIIENLTAFCQDHLHQVPFMCTDTNVECRQCCALGDIAKLLMCSTCGDHYHTTCIGLANFPDTRSGWNCQQCSKCQICRQVDATEGRSVKCEHCQKLYHATCLRPIISSIPKYGWKCNRCRVCTDCGSRTPGAGTSSRWHCHYTICDSCYQQRNKGFSCPICHKAYRAAAHKEMVKCSWCNRFVHSSCDEEADLSVYHKKKENNPDYDYYCPLCKINSYNDRSQMASNQMRAVGESSEILALSAMPSNDSQYKDTDMEYYEKSFADFNITDGKAIEAMKISKKRMGFKTCPRSRSGKMVLQKAGVLSQFSRRRGGRGKSRHLMLMSSSDSGMSDRGSNRCSDDDWNMEKKLVLFSAKDKFLLSQDICVMCGSVGIDQDGCLIACTQCGQCYHPYCANIKISLVVLQKGWRCLDCTVCEGCGQKNDEACLILCDECDISYHIYCMSPPLDKVPHGNWKCKWCAVCQKCGRNSPGKNCSWRSGFLECGPCASQRACCVCTQQYAENELIIQCSSCERWLHCQCDNINNEKEAQLCDTDDYTCILCRPKNKQFAHPFATKAMYKNGASSKDAYSGASPISNLSSDRLESSMERIGALNVANDSGEFNESTHCLDGVCVTERGLSAIKALSLEIKRKRKMRPANEAVNKDSGILVVSGSANPDDEGADDDALAKQNYKDGMVWLCPENSPPQGFSIITNDEGVNILRKKRQRNLQKLGIGGFSVRNRALKKDCDDNGAVVGTENVSAMESEKKKKIVRKKTKTKLSETYPAYLQEAFFGKALLENKEVKLSCESDSSDELGHGNFALIGHEKNVLSSNQKSIVLQSSIKQEPDVHMMGTVVKTEPGMLNVKSNALMSSADASIMSTHTTHSSPVTVQKVPADEKESALERRKPQCIPLTAIIPDSRNDPTDVINKAVLNITATRMISETSLSKPATMELQLHTNNASLSDSMPHNETLVPLHLQQPQGMQKVLQHSPHITTQLAENAHLNKEPQQQENQAHATKENITKLYIAPTPTEEPIESVVVGSQKTAEKMRRDEDLGDMATISAVLYANTQHPELKQTYPNWNDRCKQIIKRWRSLSNEKKTPFLQHAKDNRSALRMRKAQQDQEKICFQQKSLKEQEQERIWKQHQAKAKEAMTSPFGNVNSFGTDGMPLEAKVNIYSNNCILPDNTPATFNTNIMPNTVFMPSVNVIPTQRSISSIEAPNFLLEKPDNRESIVSETDNKQLRSLLLKQDFESPWLPDAAIATQTTLLPHTDVASPLCGSALPNVKQSNDIKSQMATLINKNVKISTNIAINKVDFKARTDAKSNDCTDAIGASELEKMDQDENVGFGDILGGFGEGDDEDFLKSLTADIGDDFNILEYGDPELDELATSQNLLQKLDFDA